MVNSVVPRRKQVRHSGRIPGLLRNPMATVPSLAPRAFARKGLIDRASRRTYALRPGVTPARWRRPNARR